MKKTLLGIMAAAAIVALAAPRADAKVAAIYASGQGGVQNTDGSPGLGFELGARLLLLDGYLDYTNFGGGESVGRAIAGVRAGIGGGDFRLVLRAGLGGIHEEHGALMGAADEPTSRTGGVARAGIGFDARLDPMFYLGFMVDAETFIFPGTTVTVDPTPPSYQRGADVFAALKLTFELGI
jgi:hypothetical protein